MELANAGRRTGHRLCSRKDGSDRERRIGLKDKKSGFLVALTLAMGALAVSAALGQVNVYTEHNDVFRSGQNTSETYLTTSNVNSNQFGKLFTYSLDGYAVAQPLYVSGLSIPGQGTHNVIFVATQHDSVFAYDADNLQSTPLWSVNFTNAANGITTVPIADQGCGNVTKYTEVGIMGTPVIDAGSNTMYVSVKTMENGNYVHRLHALDITTGAEKFGGPVQITGSVNTQKGTLNFDSLSQEQRPGLLLSNGVVYIAFGSNGCDRGAQGWVMAYDEATLKQVGVFCTMPNSPYGGSVWQGGVGLGADASGNVYAITANGLFDANTGGSDFGDTFLKLGLVGSQLVWTDYFTPYDQQTMSQNDLDLGSGGALLLPDQSGNYPHLILGAGKTGNIYVINRDNMGQYNPNGNSQIVQYITGQLGAVYGAPVYWNNNVYFVPVHDAIKAFSVTNGLLSTTPVAKSFNVQSQGNPSISANGNSNGILWMVRSYLTTSTMLSAFNASALKTELYNTTKAGSRDTLGGIMRFVTPTIANGRVYVGTDTQLVVYGLFPQLTLPSGSTQTATVGTQINLQVLASDPYSGNPYANVPVSFSDNKAGGSFGNSSVNTNSSGIAANTYTLPTKTGKYTLTFTSSGYATATLTLTANAGAAATLYSVSGFGQTSVAGAPLPSPIIIKAVDAYGNAISGASIQMSDSNVGGSFSPNPAVTASSGKASITYTAPSVAQTVTVTATSNPAPTLSFKEYIIAATASSQSIASGNNQAAPAGTMLPAPLVVTVTDQYGNPVSGAAVTFSDGGAGGTFSSATATTNSSGQASTSYTTPATPGTFGISSSGSGINMVTFTETAQ